MIKNRGLRCMELSIGLYEKIKPLIKKGKVYVIASVKFISTA
jgi:hypothetical protein